MAPKLNALSPMQVASLTTDDWEQAYFVRLRSMARCAGFGRNVNAYLDSGGMTFEEFQAEVRVGKARIWAHELPQVYTAPIEVRELVAVGA